MGAEIQKSQKNVRHYVAKTFFLTKASFIEARGEGEGSWKVAGYTYGYQNLYLSVRTTFSFFKNWLGSIILFNQIYFPFSHFLLVKACLAIVLISDYSSSVFLTVTCALGSKIEMGDT